MKLTTEQILERLASYATYDPVNGGFAAIKQLRRDSPKSGESLGTPAGGGYLQITIFSKQFKIHRLVWLWHYKTWPEGDIDHINRKIRDNRIENLRAVSRAVNMRNGNPRSTNWSGLVGVNYHKWSDSFRVKIVADYKTVFCKYFKTEAEAKEARRTFLRAHPELQFGNVEG